MTLSALEIKHAKTGYLLDGSGLYLQVSKVGTKSWIYRYQINGRRREMGLGSLDDVSAPEARRKATEARALVLAKIDPLEARHQKRQAEAASSVAAKAKRATFQAIAADYVAAHRSSWRNPKHVKQWEQTLDAYAFPVIGGKAVQDITTEDVLTILQPLWTEKTETASRLRSRIELVLSYAKAKKLRQGENPATWRGHLDAILPKPGKVKTVRHQPALPYAQMPAFMDELRKMPGSGARALEFAILTAARSGEVRQAKWSEIDEKEARWTVPAEHMKIKGKGDHRVPLSNAALDVLKRTDRIEGVDYIFFGSRDKRPLSDMTLSQTIKRMNEASKKPTWLDPRSKSPVVPHGFRSTFRDWAAEKTTYPHEMAEMALAHTVGNKVEAAYRREDMFEKRRQMMQDWADYLDKPRTGADVIQLRGTAA